MSNQCNGHKEAIEIWGMCKVCGATKESEWRQEYEDAVTARNLLIMKNNELKAE